MGLRGMYAKGTPGYLTPHDLFQPRNICISSHIISHHLLLNIQFNSRNSKMNFCPILLPSGHYLFLNRLPKNVLFLLSKCPAHPAGTFVTAIFNSARPSGILRVILHELQRFGLATSECSCDFGLLCSWWTVAWRGAHTISTALNTGSFTPNAGEITRNV